MGADIDSWILLIDAPHFRLPGMRPEHRTLMVQETTNQASGGDVSPTCNRETIKVVKCVEIQLQADTRGCSFSRDVQADVQRRRRDSSRREASNEGQIRPNQESHGRLVA